MNKLIFTVLALSSSALGLKSLATNLPANNEFEWFQPTIQNEEGCFPGNPIDQDGKLFDTNELIRECNALPNAGNTFVRTGYSNSSRAVMFSNYYAHDKTGHKKKYFPNSWHSVILWLDGIDLYAYGASISVDGPGLKPKWETHVFPGPVNIVDLHGNDFVVAKGYNRLRAEPVIDDKYQRFKTPIVFWNNLSTHIRATLQQTQWGKQHASQECPFARDEVFQANLDAAYFAY